MEGITMEHASNIELIQKVRDLSITTVSHPIPVENNGYDTNSNVKILSKRPAFCVD
jgi:hypothetical protein